MINRSSLLTFGCLACSIFALAGCYAQNSDVSSSASTQIIPSTTQLPVESPIPISPKINLNDLKIKVDNYTQTITQKYPKSTIGIVVESYQDGTTLEINADKQFDAASIGKLPILMLLYQKISEGEISEDEQIVINDSNVERYGTGSIQYQTLPKTYTISELAKLMIKVSDNTASSVLATRINRQKLSQFVKDKGMTGTNTVENTTVPYDTTILLRELYTEWLAGDQYAHKMISYLTDTAFENRLPAKLPKDIKVAHKIGTQTLQTHDAGIVFDPETPYGVAIYTAGISSETDANQAIATISEIIYTHFNQ